MKMYAKTLQFALAVLLLVVGCAEPDDDWVPDSTIRLEAALTEAISDQMIAENLPGVAVGIWIPGRLQYVRAFGTADLATSLPRSTDQPFRIASITKTFTALRILQLHDAGKLDLDDPLSLYYPDFPGSSAITLRHLLSMTSGIADYADTSFLTEWFDEPLMPFGLSDAIAISAARSAQFEPPGQRVVYANINYGLLGGIIEQVTGHPLADEIEQHICTPLGMSDTYYPSNAPLPGGLQGYAWIVGVQEFTKITELNPEVPGAAGAIVSTLQDLRRYAEALYAGELLSTETHQAQLETAAMADSPEWVRYGLGIMDLGGFWGHNGTVFGFSSEMFYYPPARAILVINVNRLDSDDHSHSNSLFFRLSKILFPDRVVW